MVSPAGPTFPFATSKKFEVGVRATRFENRVLLVWFPGMFSLSARQVVHLGASGFQRARMLSADAEKHELCHIAEIETDSTAVGTSVFPDLVPKDVALIAEAQGPITSMPVARCVQQFQRLGNLR